MKFKVRDGFVVKLINKLDLGNGQFEAQESLLYPGQTVDLSEAQADMRGHQIEPMDGEARAWHDSRVLVVAEPPVTGLSAQQLQAIVQQIAQQMAQQKPVE